MEICFHPAEDVSKILERCAAQLELDGFSVDMRLADPRFGDFQANGALPWAKRNKQNPREIAQKLLDQLLKDPEFDSNKITVSIAGPGFINFSLQASYLIEWLNTFSSEESLKEGAQKLENGKKVIVDFSAPNTAKEMHVGHIRSTVIGESICRLLSFMGADVLRDNHIGDWGTGFGMIIWALKNSDFNLDEPGENALSEIAEIYRKGNAAFKADESIADDIRQELVKLQQGDAENTRIWKKLTEISWDAFQEIYTRLDVSFDKTLGESFYRDKVDQVYNELTELKIAQEDQGALVVFHPEHKRFKKQPFMIRKSDGASNYATTDLATILYRTQEFKAQEILYVVDARQGDHFQQLFLTTQKWFEKTKRDCPELKHISFGTICGEDGKPIKTRDGGSIKLKDLLNESVDRSYKIVNEKNPELPEEEKKEIAEAVGLGAVRYVDLSQNRSSDYIFSWEKMLSFEGNTAPYLLYAVARIHSIFRKLNIEIGSNEEGASAFETTEELALAKKLTAFVNALRQARSDLRPHFLSSYLFELSGAFSSFYNANKVIVEDESVKARRLILCARTLLILETGLSLLGIKTLKRM